MRPPGGIALGTALSLAIAAGLAVMPAPLAARAKHSRNAGARHTLPANPSDFFCFVLLQKQIDGYPGGGKTASDQEIVNNLKIVSAFYAGRMTHYPAADAQRNFTVAYKDLKAAKADQLPARVTKCTNFYLQVMAYLGQTTSQARK